VSQFRKLIRNLRKKQHEKLEVKKHFARISQSKMIKLHPQATVVKGLNDTGMSILTITGYVCG